MGHLINVHIVAKIQIQTEKNGKYKKINFNTGVKDSLHLKCKNCHLSFADYKAGQVPYFNIGLALLLKILFAPHLSIYRLNCITDVNRASIKKIREVYGELSKSLCDFVQAYEIKNFSEFECCYENEEMLKTFEDSTNTVISTQANALWW